MPSGTKGVNTLVMNIETDGNIDLAAATGPGSKYRSDPNARNGRSSWTATSTAAGRRPSSCT